MRKGAKGGSDKSLLEDGLQRELKEVNSALNRFLKTFFTLEMASLQEYLHRVKDLLIQLTTRPASPVLTNIFSKFSNILQPFTSYSYDLSLDSLKNQLALLRDDHSRLQRKAQRMTEQLEDYRVKTARTTDFIYMLRVGNIDVDELYRRGMGMGRALAGAVEEVEEEEVELGRVRRGRTGVMGEMEVLGEALQGMGQESNLTSQYVSVKSRR